MLNLVLGRGTFWGFFFNVVFGGLGWGNGILTRNGKIVSDMKHLFDYMRVCY